MFELFDPKQEVSIRYGRLPHWDQAGVTYFVTFRTEDSVPAKLSRDWHARRDAWLRQHGIDPRSVDWKSRLESDPAVRDEYHSRFTREFMAYLDRGLGACPFKLVWAAELMASALRHFDGERYWLSDFVVMPNHVHVLACLIGTTQIEAQCESWKSYVAREYNAVAVRRGRLWQEESFDHLVRSPEQFLRFRRYIAENPERGGLKHGEYLLWSRSQ